MSNVVVIALTAERFSAALRRTVGTDCGATVGALRHGTLATRHPNVAVTGYVFDLTEWIIWGERRFSISR